MKKILFKLMSLLVSILPVMSYAHPGHGAKNVDGYSVFHYLTEPIHLIGVGLVVSLVLVLRYFIKRRRSVSDKNV